ncbi:N-acetylmuramoyl-L-alanine amidase [uncultured Ruminococcus sp.]|uniref:N-acetylmuramoyl-L-alanine amidase n=1 Tax=uncultured Ruminococcus sp. TaxID=165186 RepID=UPI0025D6CDD2|nr:N-acetylmuramoyl-L-alanine amidase [uncultured Ruminococcus sp.]
MYKMTDEEFYEVYGRMPRRAQSKKKKVKIYWGRIIIALIILVLIIVGIVKLIMLIAGKGKGKKPEKNSVTVTSVPENSEDDYYAEPSNKEADTEYAGIELTVCIDPAHGGFDKGNVAADGRSEKDDTLKISLALKDYLESCGVKVIMTRTDDSYVKVTDRCNIANDQGADIYISIHRSSTDVAGSDIHGFEAWINSAAPDTDNAFAQKIMAKLEEIGISENKGVRGGYPYDSKVNYEVNELTKMPSILLEMGYVTNSIDNQLLDANMEAYARAIGNGMIETAKELGVIDSNGARLTAGQLTSNKPAPVEKKEPAVTDESHPDDSSSQPDEDSSSYEYDGGYGEDDGQEDTQQAEDDYVYTDDGMGYYIEPMMTE